jgi:hypothetical protein
MLYVNNPVMLEIVVDTSDTTTLIQKNEALLLLMVKDCGKETEKINCFSLCFGLTVLYYTPIQ